VEGVGIKDTFPSGVHVVRAHVRLYRRLDCIFACRMEREPIRMDRGARGERGEEGGIDANNLAMQK
jgi:hypothetical protein